MKLFSLRRMEVDFWYSVVAAHVSLRLVPKVLDAVDMAFLFDECFRFWGSITEKKGRIYLALFDLLMSYVYCLASRTNFSNALRV